MRRIACAALALAPSFGACANATPAPEASAPSAPAVASERPAPPPIPSATAPAAASAEPSKAGGPAGSTSAAAASPPPVEERPDNKVLPPTDSPDLQERAKVLLDAIAHDDPSRGDPFWFPKEPFIPLKDVKDPGKYWDELHAAFGRDIHVLFKKRKSWEGATFERFELGSTPKWVKPGDEVNRIGYYRSFHGQLSFSIAGERAAIDVHTVISWQGKWFITHLSKFK